MIAYIRGKIIHSRWGRLIVDVNGMGYSVYIVPQMNLPPNCVDIKHELELYIHEHIREDAYDMYGFLSYQELELFERLISVSGVGPKVGINIMAAATPVKIFNAIESSDVTFFTSISGIGKKVAAKIILELKSKLSADDSSNVLSNSDDLGSNEVEEALIMLGYKKVDIQSVIAKIPSDISSSEDKVKWVLKNGKK